MFKDVRWQANKSPHSTWHPSSLHGKESLSDKGNRRKAFPEAGTLLRLLC
jgi:hypothetical protein